VARNRCGFFFLGARCGRVFEVVFELGRGWICRAHAMGSELQLETSVGGRECSKQSGSGEGHALARPSLA
jgi:hypothetical protein